MIQVKNILTLIITPILIVLVIMFSLNEIDANTVQAKFGNITNSEVMFMSYEEEEKSEIKVASFEKLEESEGQNLKDIEDLFISVIELKNSLEDLRVDLKEK